MMKNIFFLLIGAALNCGPAAAQNRPADGVGQSAAQAETAAPSRAVDDILLLDDAEADVKASSQAPLDKTSAADADSALLRGARFTLKQEFAARIVHPHDVVNNRTSFRMEYQKYFLDNFYLHFDLIETAFWGKDHRAKARGVDVFAESTVRDAYLQFSKAQTNVRIGRQVLIWGESDAGAITDVISPRNLSELFFISLEQSRISQFMLTVDQYSPVGDWSFFYIPRKRFNEYPDRGSAYFIDPFPGAAETTVDKGLGEYGLRWKKTFGRSDIGLMAAHLVDNDYVFRQGGFTSDGRLLIKKDAQRFNMIGATLSHATNGFLFSAEVAKKSPRAFLNPASLQVVEKGGVDTSLRTEYSLGNAGDHAVSLEAVNRHVLDWTKEILPTPRNTNTLVLGWRNTFFNSNLSANWLTVYNQTHTSFAHSLFLAYKLDGHVSLTLDTFYLNVKDRNNELFAYRGQNNAVFRILYQF